MSWASRRDVTRREDEAYCLLGIFAVNMPLIYGEGNQAFIRLQEEMIKKFDDHTLFAWRESSAASETSLQHTRRAPLAIAASEFIDSRTIQRAYVMNSFPYIMTNKGLRMSLPLLCLNGKDHLAILNCNDMLEGDTLVGIYLIEISLIPSHFKDKGDLNTARLQRHKLYHVTRASLDDGSYS